MINVKDDGQGIAPELCLAYFRNLFPNLSKALAWDYISQKVLWRLMVVKYGLKTILMVKGLPLHLLFH
jgi:hypothetical protein